MLDLKKLGLLGVGIMALTKEKADAVVKELIEKGELDPEEGKRLVIDLLKKSEEQSREFQRKVNEEVGKALTEYSPATKKELQNLEKRVEKLEKKTSKKK